VVEGLIFVGWEHPESAVTALAVVEDLDVLEDRVGELQSGTPPVAVEQLGLQASLERLHHRVVKRVADTTHRERKTRALDAVTERPRGELAAVIAVHHRAVLGLAVADRHPQRAHHQRRGLLAVDRPAHDTAGIRSRTTQQ
jgi:hypothetical protein